MRLILALLAVVVLTAASNPSAPVPREHAQDPTAISGIEQAQPKPDLRGGETPPAVVTLIPPAHPAAGDRAEAEEKAHKASADWWTLFWVGVTAVGSWALVLVTGGLWVATFRMWGATRDAANAAKSAGEVLPLVERAYVFVFIGKEYDLFSSGLIDNFLKRGGTPPKFKFMILNAGKTPAIIKSVKAGAKIGAPSDPPDYGAACEDEYTSAEFALISQEKRSPLPDGIEIKPNPQADTIEEIKRGARSLRFYVRVDYDDVFMVSHITQWYWVYNASIGWLEVCDDAGKQYNERT